MVAAQGCGTGGAREQAVLTGGGGDGEGEQPDGVGGGGDGKVEQGRRAATATRRSRGRRGRSGRFGRKLLSVAYIANPLVPVGGTNRD